MSSMQCLRWQLQGNCLCHLLLFTVCAENQYKEEVEERRGERKLNQLVAMSLPKATKDVAQKVFLSDLGKLLEKGIELSKEGIYW